MNNRFIQSVGLALLAMSCGCGQAEQLAIPAEPPRQASETETAGQSIVVDAPSRQNPAEIDSTITNPNPAIQTQVAKYQPPYPDRIDLFLAPKRAGRITQDHLDGAVELLGFVKVDRSRAVLMINGEVYPIAEGDSQSGIEVISIQPPAVVLQRGRQRWQATLEN